MRTVKELELEALVLRAQRLENDEPLGVFVLTQKESDLLQMQPFDYQRLVGLPERFCEMAMRVV